MSQKKKKDSGEWSTLAAQLKARVQGCHLGTRTRLMGKTRLGLKSRDRRLKPLLRQRLKPSHFSQSDCKVLPWRSSWWHPEKPQCCPHTTNKISRQGIHHCMHAFLMALLWSFQIARWFRSTKTNLNTLKCKQQMVQMPIYVRIKHAFDLGKENVQQP